MRHNDASAQALIAADDVIPSRRLDRHWSPRTRGLVNLDFSVSFVESVSDLVKIDAERKAVRRSKSATILAALFLYTLSRGGCLAAY